MTCTNGRACGCNDSVDLSLTLRPDFDVSVFDQPVTCHSKHPLSERFCEIMDELKVLHMSKGGDYGQEDDPLANITASAEFGVDPWVGALIRLNDKVVRLKSLLRKGYLNHEPVEDSLRDIACYAAISLVLYEQQGGRVDGS